MVIKTALKTEPVKAATVAAPKPAIAPKPTDRSVGRPSSGKILVTLRLSPKVVDAFKASGKGWQARIDEALKSHLKI